MCAKGWDTVSELSRTLAHNDIDRPSRDSERGAADDPQGCQYEKELRLSPQLPSEFFARSPSRLGRPVAGIYLQAGPPSAADVPTVGLVVLMPIPQVVPG